MKLQANKFTIEALEAIARYGAVQQFDNLLLQNWLRKALESLIGKLGKARGRIKKALTLQLNESEALALYYSCEWWIQALPNSPEALTAQNEILSPLKMII